MVVLRPMMKTLLAASPKPKRTAAQAAAALAAPPPVVPPLQVNSAQSIAYEQQLAAARGLVTQDPQRAAQVVKEWVSSDAR